MTAPPQFTKAQMQRVLLTMGYPEDDEWEDVQLARLAATLEWQGADDGDGHHPWDSSMAYFYDRQIRWDGSRILMWACGVLGGLFDGLQRHARERRARQILRQWDAS